MASDARPRARQRGEEGEAEQVAREAIDVLADTDFTWMRSIGYETLGIVLELGEDHEGAIEAFRVALDAWETKGNLVSAELLRKRILRADIPLMV